MYKRTRVTSLFVMLIVLVLSIQTSYGSTNFNDIKTSDWYYENVQTLVGDARVIIKGYPDGNFKPLNKLTKDQFLTMCVRVAGFNLENSQGYWAQNNIDKAIELEFIYPGEYIDFTSQITREEMSHILSRVLFYLYGPQDYKDIEKVNNVVKDSETFTPRYEEAIQLSYKLGIITGYPDHTFRPQAVLTRSEASAVFVRLIDAKARIGFDYDGLYEDLYGDLESHLLGGSNWVDPTTASDRKSAEEDWLLTTSSIGYMPTEDQVNTNTVSQQSSDYILGAFEYDINGPISGHIEDFEKLLLRRMPKNEILDVMNYIKQKTNYNTYLEHDEAFFYLDNDRYLVRIDEVMLGEGTKYQAAVEVNFNVWYRDSNFINNYEEDIIQIMPYTDTVIYR